MSRYTPDTTDTGNTDTFDGAVTGELPAQRRPRREPSGFYPAGTPRDREQDAYEPDGAPPRRRRPGLRIRIEGLDLRNTWQVVVGAVLLPLGVAAILLGWAGAAHGRVDQQQIPYLISGGVLGLAAVIVGCFFYFAHWLYRIYDQADLQHQEAMREQTELARAMIEALGRVPSGDGGAAQNGARPTFLATPTGSNFHLPDCPVIANRQPNVRIISQEETAKMRPCRICDPLE